VCGALVGPSGGWLGKTPPSDGSSCSEGISFDRTTRFRRILRTSFGPLGEIPRGLHQHVFALHPFLLAPMAGLLLLALQLGSRTRLARLRYSSRSGRRSSSPVPLAVIILIVVEKMTFQEVAARKGLVSTTNERGTGREGTSYARENRFRQIVHGNGFSCVSISTIISERSLGTKAEG
jgi:hypothetical protein